MLKRLMSLPPSVQVRLSGRPPIVRDGETLAAETQLMLSLLERRAPPSLMSVGPEQARLERRRMAAIAGGPPQPVASVAELQIPGGEGLIAARHYAPPTPTGAGIAPLIAFFHGGGFVFGDLDTHDAFCRMLCVHAGAHVVAVDYRLAPEHPFPAAVDDAQASYAWLCANAEALGADPARIAVAGDSAGGNLAAVLAQLGARGDLPAPALQLLIYPATDFGSRRPSRELFGEGFFLTNAEMDWFRDQYLGADAERLFADPRVSPLLADDLHGIAPAIVATAGFDPLRDEGEAYARALAEHGSAVVLRRFGGMVHGFVSAAGVSAASRDAVVELAGATRAMLAGAPVSSVAAAGRSL